MLLANIELSPIDKHRFMNAVYAVGDSIDSFWSLLHKIYVWRRLHAMGIDRSGPRGETRSCHQDDGGRGGERVISAVELDDQNEEEEGESEHPHDRARVIATVLTGFEGISGAYIETELRYTVVMNRLGNIGQAGQETNEFLRTLLAIFIYVFGVAAALNESIGGANTSNPGGRICSAVFLMWFVPSNAKAGLEEEEADYQTTCEGGTDMTFVSIRIGTTRLPPSRLMTVLQALPSIEQPHLPTVTFQLLQRCARHGVPDAAEPCDDSLPRHGNPFFHQATWIQRRRCYVLLLKDGIVGLGRLAAVFLSTSGVFNDCFCWSAYMWHRWLPGNWGREAFYDEDEFAAERTVHRRRRGTFASPMSQRGDSTAGRQAGGTAPSPGRPRNGSVLARNPQEDSNNTVRRWR
ncbi:hypothetical protein N657DRAFT_630738 [Parathielavia appendiculata]|uniref:Uncharacterized protein n=1 Tax=Parathielavia appendiculata TaxID=2587402 RepID=A0AAN6U6I5_9PEZI|nr:hypothetical protein N657DRAFT_630738 [Parathielavia appendiculata]